MKRLVFVILSVVAAVMAIACDAEYVEHAHHTGTILLIVAAAIAVLSWAIGLWKRLGDKARSLLRSFGSMIAINIAVAAMVYLSEVDTDINETLFSDITLILLLLLPIIDIIWIILTFVFLRKKRLTSESAKCSDE